ncbi:MAG: Fic family protein [Peptoniphilus sp.]|nr:Fic family protein [Peptoniphilus sp.]MDY3119220.1 Fic family protein [Peptoniphilus sp.]
MKYIRYEELLRFHGILIERYGGSDGVRDEGLLHSSLDSVFQSFDGADLYPEVLDKLIQVSYSLIRNHCFVDGNKRIGVFVLLYLLKVNAMEHHLSVEDVITIGWQVASGAMDKEQFKDFVTRKIDE